MTNRPLSISRKSNSSNLHMIFESTSIVSRCIINSIQLYISFYLSYSNLSQYCCQIILITPHWPRPLVSRAATVSCKKLYKITASNEYSTRSKGTHKPSEFRNTKTNCIYSHYQQNVQNRVIF